MYNLKFGTSRLVMTKFGEREVCNAPATEEFWQAWRSNKEVVKAAGFSVSKNDDGQWSVALWKKVGDDQERKQTEDMSRAADADIEVPVPEGCSLLPFQKAGVAFALSRPATLFGDEMGLGKTVQAIAVCNAIAAERILVVCPANVLLNWKQEIEKWSTLGAPVYLVRPGCEFPRIERGWVVINYDIAGRYPELHEREWDAFIADEVHYLKTATAQRTQALFGGRKKQGSGYVTLPAVPAKRKLVLTGTPIPNRPAEIFSPLHYLDPTRWPSFRAFARRYCEGGFNGFAYDANGASNLDELQARLRQSVMIRRLKKDVLKELPAKRRQIVPVEIENADAVLAAEREVEERTEAMIAEATNAVQEAEAAGDKAAYNDAVRKLNTVKGIAFTEMARIRHETALAKVPAVIEHLRNNTNGNKVVVFAWHRDVLAQIEEAVADQGAVVITGDTPAEDRQAIVNRFQNDPSVKFFLGNIKAAGIGLTLTAAAHVVFAELDWTPANITQAEDRCHRVGQQQSVFVQHLVLDGSLDAKMAKMVIEKQAVIDNALDTEHAPRKPEPELRVGQLVSLPTVAEEHIDVNKVARQQTADSLTPEQIEAIHEALRIVSGMDSDRAAQRNDVGFGRYDTDFGNKLAGLSRLTPRQAAAGMKLARKYRRQYPAQIYQRIFGA